VAWTHGGALPTALRMGSDVATSRTLRAFLGLCGRVPASRCAFSAGTPAATRAKFGTLLARLRRHPVTVSHTTWTYGGTLAAVQGFLATVAVERPLGDGGWPAGAQLLQGLWKASAAPGGPASGSPVPSGIPQRVPAGFYNGPEQEYAVMCSDSPNPPAARYPRLARLTQARAGAIGLPWLWLTEPCASWRGSSADRYTGPWNRPTAHPLLVIGNTGDPTTPYQDSVAMSHLLARARLLTVAGYGHSELMNPSTCAARYESRYLVTGALPRAGTVCRQNGQPFPGLRTSP
jgi:TAP-like protein